MRKDQLYDVTIRCSERKLPTILQVLDGEATLLKAEPVDKAERQTASAARMRHGVSAVDFVVQILGSVPHMQATDDYLAGKFEDKGFSRNSVSPAISTLIARHLVERVDLGGNRGVRLIKDVSKAVAS